MLAQEEAIGVFHFARPMMRLKHTRARLMNGVAASLCRGVPALLAARARRHPPRRASSGVATTLRFDAMAFSFCMLFTAAIQSLCYADVTRFATANPSGGGLPAEDRKALLDASRFHEVHSTRDLPPAVVSLCVDDNGKLADPGQNWNATDVTTDPTLPWKRLIWGAVGRDYYVVHYERGRIDHSFHILVAKLTKSDAKPRIVWHAVGHQLKDYAAFLDALRSGKLDNRLDYPH
jgi:hypothetical protein